MNDTTGFEIGMTPAHTLNKSARRTVVRSWMGFGSAGATQNTTGFRIGIRKNAATAQHQWQRFPDSLSSIAHRLRGVLVENRPAVQVMHQHGDAQTLFFVDPPYVRSTRKSNGKAYRHEMTDAEHQQLAEVLHGLAGMVIVCGYESDIYRNLYADWEQHSTMARISSTAGPATRKEYVWLNDACVRGLSQLRLPFMYEHRTAKRRTKTVNTHSDDHNRAIA